MEHDFLNFLDFGTVYFPLLEDGLGLSVTTWLDYFIIRQLAAWVAASYFAHFPKSHSFSRVYFRAKGLKFGSHIVQYSLISFS